MRRFMLAILIVLTPVLCSLNAQINQDLSKESFNKFKGDVVFSTEEINLNSFDNNQENRDFTLRDNIYVTAILDKTMKQVYADHNYTYNFDNPANSYNYAVRLLLDGDQKAQWLHEMGEEFFEYGLDIDFALATDNITDKRYYSDIVNDWARLASTFEPGEHEVSIEVVPLSSTIIGNNPKPVATGTFNLNVKKEDQEILLTNGTTTVPPATLINPEIEEKVVSASDDVYDNADPIKAYITDVNGNWTYTKDEHGHILYRDIVSSVVFQFTPGEKCWVKSGVYTQKHQGNGEFGPVLYSKETNGYYDYQIPCAKVLDQYASSP